MPPAEFPPIVDPVDGTVWHVDGDFLSSNWICIWDRGCEGILDTPSPELQQGCCSVGAQLVDDDEAMRIAALASTLDSDRFQHAPAAEQDGVFADEARSATRIIDGACIFLNRPGFAGGVGCALHLEALNEEDHPMDWKPAVCWQVPMVVDDHGDGSKTLRSRTRADWNGEMAWLCTERPRAGLADAFIGDASAATALHDELRGLVGPEVAVEIRRRFG